MSDTVTYIGFVQDHSGSMENNKKLAIDNFNEQRAKLLKEDDETMDNLVTIVEFDDDIHCNVDNVPIDQTKKITDWWCGGMTALYDAIAFCISNIKKKMDLDKREDKATLIVIQTDGAENASFDYSGEEGRKKINKLINSLEDTKLWTFVFLGENIDEQVAMDMGFKSANIMNHQSGDDNVSQAYAVTQDSLTGYMNSRKRGETQVMNFYDGNNDNDTNDNDGLTNDNNQK